MKNKIKSSIYGFIVGDALGVPVEFKSREYLENNPIKEMIDNKSRLTTKGYWSDDTAMTLCTMQSIADYDFNNNDNLNFFELYESMMDNYYKWLKEGYKAVDNKCFGIGQNTFRVLMDYKKSNSFLEYYIKNNPEKENKGGNGALMRILPLILYLYNNDLKKYEKYSEETQRYRKIDKIEMCNNITHNNTDSRHSCVFYTMFIFNLLDLNNLKDTYKKTVDDCIKWYSGFPCKSLKRILQNELLTLDKSEIKSSGYVIDTLEASLWCLFNTNNLKDAVLTAVNLGGDTDTIGAITGSLAGLYYGIDSIPKEWINELKEQELLTKDIDAFINKVLEG